MQDHSKICLVELDGEIFGAFADKQKAKVAADKIGANVSGWIDLNQDEHCETPSSLMGEEVAALKAQLAELERLARPFMHHAKGDYNQAYRGRYGLTLQEAGQALVAYFEAKS